MPPPNWNMNFAPGGGVSPQGIPTGLPGYADLKSAFNAFVTSALGLRTLEWLFAIPFHKVVPAGGDSGEISIKNDAHFECFFITGSFTTLEEADEVTIDDGVNHLSLRITDGSNDLKLFNDFIPANLFLSPGRVLSSGIAGDPTSPLFYPFPFHHIFPANGAIQIELQNNAQVDNTLDLLFWGRKLRATVPSQAADT